MTDRTEYSPASKGRDRAALHVAALRRFIDDEGAARRSRTRHRYHRVLTHLLLYLDTADVEPHLGTGPAVLLAGERRLGSECSFFRIMGFDELVASLPGFVEPEWMLPTRGDARSQLNLTERMLNRLRRDRLIDMGVVACAYWEAQAAVGRARRRLSGYVDEDQDEWFEPRGLRVIRGGLDW